jgi:hypothetical protein
MKAKIPNIFISVGVLFALTGLLSADKPQPTIITFDAPGAGTGPGQGTHLFGSQGLNPAEAITGTSFEANNVAHGFLRAKDGTTVFDAAGAGTAPAQGTQSGSINPAGAIAAFSI